MSKKMYRTKTTTSSSMSFYLLREEKSETNKKTRYKMDIQLIYLTMHDKRRKEQEKIQTGAKIEREKYKE